MESFSVYRPGWRPNGWARVVVFFTTVEAARISSMRKLIPVVGTNKVDQNIDCRFQLADFYPLVLGVSLFDRARAEDDGRCSALGKESGVGAVRYARYLAIWLVTGGDFDESMGQGFVVVSPRLIRVM